GGGVIKGNSKISKRISLKQRITLVAFLIATVSTFSLTALTYFIFNLIHEDLSYLMYYMFAMAVISSLITSFLVRSALVRFLNFAVKRIKNANHILDENVEPFKARQNDGVNSDDDIVGELYDLFAQNSQINHMLLKDVMKLGKKHIDGYYEFYLDESLYEGGHRVLVKTINDTLKMYVSDFVEILTVVKSWGAGDFKANVSTYQENWKWANEEIDALREHFTHLVSEINSLSKNISAGNFGTQIDTAEWDGDWRTIIEGLNNIPVEVDKPLSEIKEVMTLIANRGKLDKKVEGDYKGKFLAVKTVVNNTIDILENIIKDIQIDLAAIADGDLTTYLDNTYPGDFDIIRNSLNSISKTLNKIVLEINQVASYAAKGVSQISKSAVDLADGSYKQSVAVQDLTNSMEIIGEQTKQNAESSITGRDISFKSSENAEKGNESMKKFLVSMNEIQESSNNISLIIKTIQDIAFQTNLLALNASVEAARAGEHGRGFAVVAEEVRALATRSQTAAKETADLIESSINRVDTGSNFAHSTAGALDVIVKSANEVLDITNKISSSSQEQSESINKLNDGISEISTVIQDNSALSQEVAATAQELNAQAELLYSLVSYFKLKDE
ncbi:MAG: methyl-accepting chemotaxis protein, partial [Defluviitaleaceae bacterium]|nr:methyl-accepting chemotaxis protein [Defluviitaleaceae bacterium]